jgi:hypothetical protein
MPSRDPRHDGHYKASCSRAFHQSRRTEVWWFVRVRRAELLSACCAKGLAGVVSATGVGVGPGRTPTNRRGRLKGGGVMFDELMKPADDGELVH